MFDWLNIIVSVKLLFKCDFRLAGGLVLMELKRRNNGAVNRNLTTHDKKTNYIKINSHKIPNIKRYIETKCKQRYLYLPQLMHYMIMPDDFVVLNSLEIVDREQYIYRLLKFFDFDHIYFTNMVGGTQHMYGMSVYDEKSYNNFPNIKNQNQHKNTLNNGGGFIKKKTNTRNKVIDSYVIKFDTSTQ